MAGLDRAGLGPDSARWGLLVNTYTCATCGSLVPRHEAAVRSVAFRQVAYCRPCFEDLMSLMVPPPRVAVDDLITPRAV